MRKHQRNSESKEDLIQRLENEYVSQTFFSRKCELLWFKISYLFNLSKLESNSNYLNVLFDETFHLFYILFKLYHLNLSFCSLKKYKEASHNAEKLSETIEEKNRRIFELQTE